MKKLIIAGILIVAVLLVYEMCYSTRGISMDELSYSDLRRAIDAGNVKSALIVGNVIEGRYVTGKEERNFRTVIPESTVAAFADALYQKGIDVLVEREASWLVTILLAALIAVSALLVLCASRIYGRSSRASAGE
jgi:hypothetical protein